MMGRELRRVPADWEHPRNERGAHKPMVDESFEDAFAEWHDGLHAWLKDEHDDQNRARERGTAYPESYLPTARVYVEWAGFPEPDWYRPSWSDEERTHYQVYETVSEGTPVSPVFATTEGVVDWWVNVGDSFNGRLTREQAERWVEAGSSPSMTFSPNTGLVAGAQSL